MIWRVAALTAGVTLAVAVANADPAQDLFTGQNKLAAEGQITRFACHNCHGRDGHGGIEGDVPEIAGTTLLEPNELRPAYTFSQFYSALKDGVDPSGRVLSRTMPRYDLTEAELALLWDYLQELPSRQVKGVSPSHVRFGVVIDPEHPKLGARYLSNFKAEMTRRLGAGTVYGRKIEIVALRDPVDQAHTVIAALAMPPNQNELTEQLVATGLPVIFTLTSLSGSEDVSIQRGFVPTDRDINGAIASHLATTAARRIGISAEPARIEDLSYMIRLAIPEAEVGSVRHFPLDGEAMDAVIDLDGNLPVGMSKPVFVYRLASRASETVHAEHSFLVIEAPSLIELAIDEGLHPLEAHSVLSARILAKVLTRAGRDLSRSRLLSVLDLTNLVLEHLDYARLPLSGSDYVSIIEILEAEKR